MKKVLLVFLVSFVAAGCNLQAPVSSENTMNNQANEKKSSDVSTGELETLGEDESYVYYLEAKDFDKYGFDKKIIRTDKKTQTSETLIESIFEAGGIKKGSLGPYSFPQDSRYIFLVHNFPDTDLGSNDIWKFNIETKKLSELSNINSIFTGWNEQVLSPDGKFILAAVDGENNAEWGISKHLYLLDLTNDSKITLVTLPDTQTFNAGYGALSNHWEINWLNNITIEYSIFKQTKMSEHSEELKPLIEKKTLKVR